VKWKPESLDVLSVEGTRTALKMEKSAVTESVLRDADRTRHVLQMRFAKRNFAKLDADRTRHVLQMRFAKRNFAKLDADRTRTALLIRLLPFN
jgi:hypothetical protein